MNSGRTEDGHNDINNGRTEDGLNGINSCRTEDGQKGAYSIQDKGTFSIQDMVYIGIFSALIAVCSWVSIPLVVPVTLQTFGVFLACLVLGGKRGTVSVLIFILLGAVGLPVFHGFTGGPGILLGTTGGYIIGFLASALVLWALERVSRGKPWATAASLVLALLACYALGTAWFMVVYSRANGPVGILTVLGWCVIPFIIPDLAKIALAMIAVPAIRKGTGIH